MEKERLTKRELITGIVLAALFAFFLTAGWQIERGMEKLFRSVWIYAGVLIFTPIFAVFIIWSYRRLFHGRQGGTEVKRKCFLIGWAAMILCWIPVLLAGYPGFFCYDATYQFNEVMSGIYDMHHPLLHTFMLGKTLTLANAYLGGFDAGVLIFCILQMIFITGSFMAVIWFMARRKAPRGVIVASYIYYALYPVCSLFGLCTTKDSLFTACMTVHLLLIFELLEERVDFFKSKPKVFLYILSAVFTMLFRNNGVYTYVLFLPFLLILAKGIRRKSAVLAGSCIAAAFFITGILGVAFSASKNDGLRELLSVPAQQLARVYNIEGEEAFGEEKDVLYRFISKEDLGRYREKLADPVKANLKVGLNSTLPDFISLWIKLGVHEPEIYADAFFVQTYQAWYPFTIPDGYCGESAKPRYRGSESCYFALEAEEPVQAGSKLPGLLKFYEFISRHMTFDTVFLIPVFFSIGTMFWLLIYMLGYSICYRRKGAAGMLLMVLCLCLTCLFGPIVLVRYYLILFFAMPLVVSSSKLV